MNAVPASTTGKLCGCHHKIENRTGALILHLPNAVVAFSAGVGGSKRQVGREDHDPPGRVLVVSTATRLNLLGPLGGTGPAYVGRVGCDQVIGNRRAQDRKRQSVR